MLTNFCLYCNESNLKGVYRQCTTVLHDRWTTLSGSPLLYGRIFLLFLLDHACTSPPPHNDSYLRPLCSTLASPSLHPRDSNEWYGRCHCQWIEHDRDLTVEYRVGQFQVSSVQFQAWRVPRAWGAWLIVVVDHGGHRTWEHRILLEARMSPWCGACCSLSVTYRDR